MSGKVEPDATPFPPRQPEVEEPVLPPSDKEKAEEKDSSEESLSSDSEPESTQKDNNNASKGSPSVNVVNINRAHNVQIGTRYNVFQTSNTSTHHHYTETDSSSDLPYEGDKGPEPPRELLNSTRRIDEAAVYIVAENISKKWKKLARFLPPGSVFTDVQLERFERQNPHDEEEAIVNMLKAWKMKAPEHATIGVLAHTLWNIGKGAIARKLQP